MKRYSRDGRLNLRIDSSMEDWLRRERIRTKEPTSRLIRRILRDYRAESEQAETARIAAARYSPDSDHETTDSH